MYMYVRTYTYTYVHTYTCTCTARIAQRSKVQSITSVLSFALEDDHEVSAYLL